MTRWLLPVQPNTHLRINEGAVGEGGVVTPLFEITTSLNAEGWRTGSFSSAYDSLVNCTCPGLFSKQHCYQLFFCQNPKFLKKKLLTHMKPLDLYFRLFSPGKEVGNLKIVKLLAWKVIISNHSPLQGSLGGGFFPPCHTRPGHWTLCVHTILFEGP